MSRIQELYITYLPLLQVCFYTFLVFMTKKKYTNKFKQTFSSSYVEMICNKDKAKKQEVCICSYTYLLSISNDNITQTRERMTQLQLNEHKNPEPYGLRKKLRETIYEDETISNK